MARVVIYMAEWCSICRGTIKRIVPALSEEDIEYGDYRRGLLTEVQGREEHHSPSDGVRCGRRGARAHALPWMSYRRGTRENC